MGSLADRIGTSQTRTCTETKVRCAVCGERLKETELAGVRRDIDFVPHGERGHLIRIEA